MEDRDAAAISRRQASLSFDSKEPELMKVAGVERAQNRIVALRVRVAITRRHLVNLSATFVSDRTEILRQ